MLADKQTIVTPEDSSLKKQFSWFRNDLYTLVVVMGVIYCELDWFTLKYKVDLCMSIYILLSMYSRN